MLRKVLISLLITKSFFISAMEIDQEYKKVFAKALLREIKDRYAMQEKKQEMSEEQAILEAYQEELDSLFKAHAMIHKEICRELQKKNRQLS